MKNMRRFLIGWMILHLLILFPMQSEAEEDVVQDQDISKVEQQEEQKQEVEEKAKQAEKKQIEDSKEVKGNEQKIEQNQEKKIETELGLVTLSKQDITIGEKVRIAIEPKEQNIQSIKGILQLQKNDEQYVQERMLSFEYEEETKQWIAYYKAESYDLEGDWHLQFIQSRKEVEKEKLIEAEATTPLFHIKNETPVLDNEPPKLEKLIIDESKDGIVERKSGDSFNIRVKTSDVESAVKEVRVILTGKEGNSDTTFFLDYNKRDMEWQKTYEITEALLTGTYRLVVEITDAAGNKLVQGSEYTVSVVEQKPKENEKIEEQKKEETIEEGKQNEQKVEQQKVEQQVLEEEKPQIVHIPNEQEKISNLKKETPKIHKEKSDEKDDKVVLKKKEKAESKKEEQETESEKSIRASNVFAIISGLFVLFFVLKNNKEWG
ncbi:transglycosylase [Bacillus anthracis]|nr:transglycosylase [Bacillus anthracis]